MTERVGEHQLSPDERYELALSAEASARRNRPSHLVVAAGLVFIVSCAMLGFTSCRAERASQDLQRRITQRDTIANLLAELRALKPEDAGESADVMSPYLGFRSEMEQIAQRVGVPGKLEFPRERRSQELVGIEKVTYDYTIKGESLGPLLAFVKEATATIPGLRVAGLGVRPRKNQWELSVKFERWERMTQP
ncbi:MAG TPA: hypothetical protein ENK11_08690 [Phycisphaerales bacterium]|nr:hypothetical protein [Phycisphaerales bacterium]